MNYTTVQQTSRDIVENYLLGALVQNLGQKSTVLDQLHEEISIITNVNIMNWN